MSLTRQSILFLLAAALLSPMAAQAQRALVLSTSRNSAHAPVGVHAQVLDVPTASALPGIVTVPGRQITQTLDAVSRAGAVYLSTGPNDRKSEMYQGDSYMVGLETSPLQRSAVTHFSGEGSWEYKVVGKVRDEDGREHTVALASALDGSASKLSFYEWGVRGTLETRRWGILGEISDAIVLEDAQRVVALYRSGGQRPGGVMMGPMGASPNLRITLPAPEEGGGAFQPLKVAQFGDALLVLGIVSHKDAPEESHLWAQLIEVDTLALRGRAVPLSGTQMGSAAPLLEDGANGCWISSRSPDTRFAYVSRVFITATGLEKTAAYSLPKTSTPVYMAQAPGTPALALVYNETLEIWPDAKRENLLLRQFSEPLGALAWMSATQLLLGEAGRIHIVNIADITVSNSLQLQSGWIEKIIPLPNYATVASDQDHDGIVDALDPEPVNPSPKLELPYKITFRGDAVGHEVRAIKFSPDYYDDASWRVEAVDALNAEWLHMAPRKGVGPSAVYMGVDPERYERGTWAETWLKVHLDGVTMRDAYGSPQWVLAQVQPQGEMLRRILWVWDTAEQKENLRDVSDPRGVRNLANFLAAPPHYFSQRETLGLVDFDLEQYTILVVRLRALAQGQLIRSELLDYVVGGGAVLILGDLPIDPLPNTLHEWFRPAGVDILLASPLSGNVPAMSFDSIDATGIELPVKQGARFVSQTGAIAPLDPGKGESAALAMNYGYGRLLFLADSNVLQSPVLQDEHRLRFVLSCFTWLAGAGAEFGDMDGDLLVDGIEDVNDNGIVDGGETDFLDPDSDGDFLPDGEEDLNRNGKVDAGETDPRNPDTDGDNIWDAADATPFPETDVLMPILDYSTGAA